jgi:ankyrin repeat protein
MEPLQELFEAIEAGDLSRINTLLDRDPSLATAKAKHDITALHRAAEKDQAQAAEALLAAGAELEAKVSWGMTPLEWAANMGSRRAAAIFLDRGAHLTHWAAAGLGMLDAMQSFWHDDGTLKPGCGHRRPKQQDAETWTWAEPNEDRAEIVSDSFYIACRNGHTAAARFLLDRGANINFRGFFGGAGLHWAAINGHKDTVEFLVANGADASLEDHQFQSTPLGWAHETNQRAIIELLSA